LFLRLASCSAGRFAVVLKGEDAGMDDMDREIDGAAAIYERAVKWGHLPAAMTFERFLAALRRGDDPYLEARCVLDAH
jgi:hypothetical protein